MSKETDILLVIRNPKEAVPTVLWEKIISNGYTGWMTHAAVIKGNIEISALIGEEFSASELDNVQEEHLAFPSIFAFGKDPQENEDNIPPFILWEKDGNEGSIIRMVAYPVGEYASYAEEGSQIGGHYKAFCDYLYPKITKLIPLANNDTKGLIHILGQKEIKQELSHFTNSNGLVLFHDNNGYSVFGKMFYYPWGWLSKNPFGYTEHGYPSSDLKEVGKTVAKRLGRTPPGMKKEEEKPIIGNQEFSPQPTKPPEQPATTFSGAIKGSANTPPKPVEQKPEKEKPVDPQMLDPGVRKNYYRPPLSLKTRDELRKGYMENCGFVPDNFRKRPAVPLKGSAVLREVVETTTAIGEKLVNAAEKLKDTASHHIVSKVLGVETEVSVKVEEKKEEKTPPWNPSTPPSPAPKQIIPILDDATHKAITAFRTSDMVKKIVGHHGETLQKNPKYFHEAEKRAPTYSSAQNMTFEELLTTPFEVWVMMAETWPKAVAMIADELRNEFIKLRTQQTNNQQTPPTSTGPTGPKFPKLRKAG